VLNFPKMRNAKVMRRVIRAAYLGEPPGDERTRQSRSGRGFLNEILGRPANERRFLLLVDGVSALERKG
jgi:hypothetical protein